MTEAGAGTGAATRWGVGLLASTWTFAASGNDYLRELRVAGVPIVYVIWHGGLLPALWRHRGEPTALLVSEHRDGSHLAAAAAGWGYRLVRGSSTHGAARGLLGVIHRLEQGGDVALTPDGPCGPARVAKAGAAAAAQRTGAAVVPVGTAASCGWRVGSWDRFLIPRPFARVQIVYDRPFTVGVGRRALVEGARRLQEGLDRATGMAECRA